MQCIGKTPEGIEALNSVVTKGKAERAGEVVETVAASVTGRMWGEEREAAGCAEICPVLISAMARSEYTGSTVNDVKVRIKDAAARALVILREGAGDEPGMFVEVDPKFFNQDEPDEKKRDVQIDALKKWYDENKDRLEWDSAKGHFAVKKEG